MRHTEANDRSRDWFEALFCAHFDQVLRYALLRTDPESAREVASQTFVVAWRRRDAIGSPVLPWLLVVARNLLAEHRRASRRRRGVLERVASAQTAERSVLDPAETVAHRDAVVAAFLELSEADREVLRLVAWDNLSNEDAARVVGCRAGAFAVRLSRARRRLEARMSEQEVEAPGSLPTQLEAT